MRKYRLSKTAYMVAILKNGKDLFMQSRPVCCFATSPTWIAVQLCARKSLMLPTKPSINGARAICSTAHGSAMSLATTSMAAQAHRMPFGALRSLSSTHGNHVPTYLAAPYLRNSSWLTCWDSTRLMTRTTAVFSAVKAAVMTVLQMTHDADC